MIKTLKFNLTWIAYPQTMFEIEAGATYSSKSPPHGVLFQNRSLLKKVTEHTAQFSASLKIIGKHCSCQMFNLGDFVIWNE